VLKSWPLTSQDEIEPIDNERTPALEKIPGYQREIPADCGYCLVRHGNPNGPDRVAGNELRSKPARYCRRNKQRHQEQDEP
jgi:hypothetical protein